ncbi:MAG: DUF1853 family protein, partial [Christiangramia sp.]|nr:DUF1853 family protein [Christiangramia sp.]
ELQDIEQQLCFKAQLFLPDSQNNWKPRINEDCLKGKWFRFKEFEDLNLQENHFYCPKKKYWSCDPACNSQWISYSELLEEIDFLFDKKRSPLVWMKTKTSYLSFFIVWW